MYIFFMVYSLGDKYLMTQGQQLFGNIHCSYQHYQPGKISLQVSVVMIELVLVATSYEPLMM